MPDTTADEALDLTRKKYAREVFKVAFCVAYVAGRGDPGETNEKAINDYYALSPDQVEGATLGEKALQVVADAVFKQGAFE